MVSAPPINMYVLLGVYSILPTSFMNLPPPLNRWSLLSLFYIGYYISSIRLAPKGKVTNPKAPVELGRLHIWRFRQCPQFTALQCNEGIGALPIFSNMLQRLEYIPCVYHSTTQLSCQRTMTVFQPPPQRYKQFSNLQFFYVFLRLFMFFCGRNRIRTCAPIIRPNGLANRPLEPLGYSSLFVERLGVDPSSSALQADAITVSAIVPNSRDGRTRTCKILILSQMRLPFAPHLHKAMIYSAYKKPKKTMAKNLQDSPK